jgi:hypothetical protein
MGNGNETLVDSEVNINVKTTDKGTINAIVVWWQVELWEGIFLSSMDKGSHWGQHLMLFAKDIEVSKGESIRINAAHNTTHQMYNIGKIQEAEEWI